MSTEKIDWSKMTPEAAYDRIIAIGESFIERFPRNVLEVGKAYSFDFDISRNYIYVGSSQKGFFHHFATVQGVKLTSTKYSPSPTLKSLTI